MPSQTKENYLKMMYLLADEDGEIGLSELSREMGVSIPSSNSMVKKLQENDWVIYEKYRPLKLTSKGQKTAALIIRKHRLTEMYLVEKMSFGWEEVHDIAEQLEHVHSKVFFDRIDEILGYPKVDPHGSPIPDKNGNVEHVSYISLSSVQIGSIVKMCALQNSSSDFLSLLNSKQIKLGTVIEVVHVESFDQSYTVNYDDKENVVLSSAVCDRLLVEKV